VSSTSLSGVRIWLSGSIDQNTPPDESARVLEFTSKLAAAAFREGAVLMHGGHPRLTPTLLDAAQTYKQLTGQRPSLHLLVSTHFPQESRQYDGIGDRLELADLEEIPEGVDREQSLYRLRDALAARADVLVAIGGLWWKSARTMAGVPAEFELAVERGIPSFLLGGLGGAVAGYLEDRDEILRDVRNGLDKKANLALADETDPQTLVDKIVGQMARLPLGRRETLSGEPFRILCLDGGGVRGAFTAAVLARWEESGKKVVDHFDLIAGTSTGGILAIGLGLGLPAQSLLEFYRNNGEVIFPMTSLSERVRRKLLQVFQPKFEPYELDRLLCEAYDSSGEATLAEAKTRLLITSYNMTANAVKLYRTPHYPGLRQSASPRAVSVGRATSAAPTYFPPAVVEETIASHEAVDGGVWANCPAMAAIGEASRVLKIPLDRIELLSVGTAGFAPILDTPSSGGLSGWALKAVDLFMNSQMEATLLYASQLLGDRFVRVDDDMPSEDKLDDPKNVPKLAARGVKTADKHADRVFRSFLNGSPVRSRRQESK
jgi:hypothetical protein